MTRFPRIKYTAVASWSYAPRSTTHSQAEWLDRLYQQLLATFDDDELVAIEANLARMDDSQLIRLAKGDSLLTAAVQSPTKRFLQVLNES